MNIQIKISQKKFLMNFTRNLGLMGYDTPYSSAPTKNRDEFTNFGKHFEEKILMKIEYLF